VSVSDTAALDAAADKSGPTIRSILDGRVGFSCAHHLIVPDEVSAIQDAVMKCIKHGDVDWIITTGGTGFGVRDFTPEVGLAPSFSLSTLKSYICL
jgi:gephyrin